MKTQRLHGKLMVIALAVAAAVAACGDHNDDDLNRLIDTGQAQQALAQLTDRLADAPADPALLGLALKAQLVLCAAENCPASNRVRLQEIASLLGRQPATPANRILSPAVLLAEASRQLANQPTMPQDALALLEVTPPHLQPAVINGLFAAPLEHLRNGKTAVAGGMYQALSTTEKLVKPQRYWALLLHGLVVRQPAQVEGAVVALRSQPAATQLPPAAMAALPHVLLAIRPEAAELAQNLPPLLNDWNIPLLQPVNRAAMADEINHLRTTPALLAPLAGGSTPLLTSASTVLNSGGALAQIYLMRLSLALNPSQTELWQTYVAVAARALTQGGPVTLLGGAGAPTQPPVTVQEEYVAALFKLVEVMARNKHSLAPLLEQLQGLKLDKASAVRLERMVKDGLDNAINDRRLEDIVAFTTFRPNVARSNRQTVVPLLLEAIGDELQQGNFPRAEELSALMQSKLDVDVNYDSVVLKEFETYARVGGLLDSLSANSPDTLLQPAASQLDMGKLWGYVATRFAGKPEVIDQQLRNLVAGARGLYGTPTAMYRLAPLFPESTFATEARRAYLAQAIAQAVRQDDRLSGAETAELAWRLSRVHEGLPLGPLVQTALERATTVEEGQVLWEQSPAPVRDLIATLKPQFAALMRGIEAWDAGHTGRAAASFAQLDAGYAEQAAPYLAKLADQLAAASGLYAPVTLAELPAVALIAVQAPALDTSGTLTDLNITLHSLMGARAVANPATLTTSYGAVDSVAVPATFDYASQRATFAASSKLGGITGLQWGSGSLTLLRGSQPPLVYRKLTAKAEGPLLPEGTFTINRQVSAANSATDVILPLGSLLTVTTSATPKSVVNGSENLGTIHAATLNVRHPGMAKPQEVEGYYQPSNHTLNFTFAPPLVKGGVAKAAVRCQLLGDAMLCGASHTHANRVQFAHRVLALQTREDAARAEAARAEANAAQLAAWQQLPPSRLLPAATLAGGGNLIEVFPASVTPTVVSGSVVSASVVAEVGTASVSSTTASVPSVVPAGAPVPVVAPAATREILPPPDFMQAPEAP